ncbi:hypothetical protein FB45DRAFT_886025 [Roridomyces roridus]|uniref:Fungal-type protein kinase domain-containing protein n=1 Tax=Roridomyces roridus TaxID=1738132 RepID=A0AAD7G0N1_9AGAR|nr:hypothetical protein FB45DRAFT_937327 [Roridomyces roridus]KAJ7649800.1 hypothetical protein FB45DRAFT_886025 [Roridomyces roridus]
MYRRIDGEIHGVLNDFDLSQFLDDSCGSTSDERTGTTSFMALDLLDTERPPKHLPRHDLESFMYVLVFLVCDIADARLRRWDDLEMDQAHNFKFRTLCKGFPPPRHGFGRFAKWTFQLRNLFARAVDARFDAETIMWLNRGEEAHEKVQELPEVDNETLGGRVTFDTFAAALCQLYGMFSFIFPRKNLLMQLSESTHCLRMRVSGSSLNGGLVLFILSFQAI